jgi:hypothetical protein
MRVILVTPENQVRISRRGQIQCLKKKDLNMWSDVSCVIQWATHRRQQRRIYG